MSGPATPDLAAMSAPAAAAWLCAVDPEGLGGIVVRARAGPARDRWLALLRGVLPAGVPVRRLPVHADAGRIFGGLDLAATLAAGRPVAERGILADTDGGVLILAMAERLPGATAARLGLVLDTGTVTLERDGISRHLEARLGIVALDEGLDDDEHVSAALADRLAFWIDLDGFDPGEGHVMESGAIARARAAGVTIDDSSLRALGEAALALGVVSMRASVLAVRAARAAAALAGRDVVATADAALAARLILAPRATRMPVAPEPPAETEPPHEEDAANRPEPPADHDDASADNRTPASTEDIVLAAAKAAIPPGLLARLQAEALSRSGPQGSGRAGAVQVSGQRGRPAGLRRGRPGAGARLNIIETLRAAAPWQRLRAHPAAAASRRIEVRGDDLRITRFKQHTETTTVFVVDASGSLAANRLAEAKGAVEMLLAECYVRRDQVALLAFRGTGTDLLLPPTRSLARAKRSLSALPGGGATPLAGAIDAATALAVQIRRRGQTPVVVFLTDGRANVARDGTTGRGQAEQDAQAAARMAAATGVRMLLVDAAPRPQPPARALAASLKALYIPLPRADAGALSHAIRTAT